MVCILVLSVASCLRAFVAETRMEGLKDGRIEWVFIRVEVRILKIKYTLPRVSFRDPGF